MAWLPDATWAQVLIWSNSYFRLVDLSEAHFSWHGGYVGLSLLLVSGSAAAVSLRLRDTPLSAFVAGSLISLWLVFGHDYWPLADFSPAQAFNSGRYLLFVVFFLSASTGCAVSNLKGRVSTRVLLAVGALILLDVGSTTFRHPYSPEGSAPVLLPDFAFDDEPVTENWPEIAPHRVYASTSRDHDPTVIAWVYHTTGMPVLQGLYNESPRSWTEFARPWAEFLQMEPPASDSQNQILEFQQQVAYGGALLFNVRNLLMPASNDEYYRLKIRQAGPAIASANPLPYPEQAILRQGASGDVALQPIARVVEPELWSRAYPLLWTLSRLGLAASGTTSRNLYLREDFPSLEPSDSVLEARVLAHEVNNQAVKIRLTVSRDCYARLSYSYDPFLNLSIDGESSPYYETATRFIAVKLDAGEHTIELRPRLSALRIWTLCLSAVTFAALLVWTVADRRLQRPTF